MEPQQQKIPTEQISGKRTTKSMSLSKAFARRFLDFFVSWLSLDHRVKWDFWSFWGEHIRKGTRFQFWWKLLSEMRTDLLSLSTKSMSYPHLRKSVVGCWHRPNGLSISIPPKPPMKRCDTSSRATTPQWPELFFFSLHCFYTTWLSPTWVPSWLLDGCMLVSCSQVGIRWNLGDNGRHVFIFNKKLPGKKLPYKKPKQPTLKLNHQVNISHAQFPIFSCKIVWKLALSCKHLSSMSGLQSNLFIRMALSYRFCYHGA